jgi:hypothetical protein
VSQSLFELSVILHLKKLSAGPSIASMQRPSYEPFDPQQNAHAPPPYGNPPGAVSGGYLHGQYNQQQFGQQTSSGFVSRFDVDQSGACPPPCKKDTVATPFFFRVNALAILIPTFPLLSSLFLQLTMPYPCSRTLIY